MACASNFQPETPSLYPPRSVRHKAPHLTSFPPTNHPPPIPQTPLRGVKRDAWSLTWDAFLEAPAQGSGGKTSILQGFKQARAGG